MSLFNHTVKPAPFNPLYRKGLGEAVSAKYGQWCDANPDSTQNDRRNAYAIIHSELEPKFPSCGEMGKDFFSTDEKWIPA